MKFIRLYVRVLELLGREARLGWTLAIANLALASAMFVEPILFGRIVDTLANAQGRLSELAWTDLMTAGRRLGRLRSFHRSSAARWSRCMPIASPIASTRWCERCSSSTCCSCR